MSTSSSHSTRPYSSDASKRRKSQLEDIADRFAEFMTKYADISWGPQDVRLEHISDLCHVIGLTPYLSLKGRGKPETVQVPTIVDGDDYDEDAL